MSLKDILTIQNNRMIKQLVPENLQNVSGRLAERAKQVDLDVQKARIDLINTSAGNYYIKCLSTDTGALLVVTSGAITGQINLSSVIPRLNTYTPVAGDYVTFISNTLTAGLNDIKVGADGKVWNTPSEAVRGQVGLLNEGLADLQTGKEGTITSRLLIETNGLMKAIGNGQLFDYTNNSRNKLYIRTTDNVIQINEKSEFYVVYVDGMVGESFCFKIFDVNKTEANIFAIRILTFNEMPYVGCNIIESNTLNKDVLEDKIILTVPAKYVAIFVVWNDIVSASNWWGKVGEKLSITKGDSFPEEYIGYYRPVQKTVDENLKKALKVSGIKITSLNVSNYFSDFDFAPINSVYEIDKSTTMTNMPIGSTTRNNVSQTDNGKESGLLMTIGSAGGGKTQFYMTFYNNIFDNTDLSSISFRVNIGDKWSNWTKFNPMLVCQGSNTVIRNETKENFFTDLNNAPDNSIYQLDLNCVEGSLANDPCPGESRVLQTVNFSTGQGFGKYQLLVARKHIDNTTRIFFRYGYVINGVRSFTSWKEVSDFSNCIHNNGIIKDIINFETITENCVYFVKSSDTHSDSPEVGVNGILTTKYFGANMSVQEYLTESGNFYHRFLSATGWGNWKKVLCEDI